MKKTDLVLLSVALLISWRQATGQDPGAFVGTGYPTMMGPPGCHKSIHHSCPAQPQPALAENNNGRRVAPAGQTSVKTSATPSVKSIVAVTPQARGISTMPPPPAPATWFTITAGNHHGYSSWQPFSLVQFSSGPPQPSATNFPPPYQMDYHISIGTIQSQSKCETIQIGYLFPYPQLGTKLQLFKVSIFEPGNGTAIYDQPMSNKPPIVIMHNGFQISTYPLPSEAAGHFKTDNTLVLHADGFNDIFVGVWCNLYVVNTVNPSVVMPNTLIPKAMQPR